MISGEETKITGTLHFLKFAFLPAIKEEIGNIVPLLYIYSEKLVHFVKNSRTRQSLILWKQ